MGKTLGYGEITVANMTEPFTVMLTNEAQQFATDSNRKVTSAQSYYTDIIVIRGSQERTDYTIGNITSGSGITVSKNNKRVTFSVNAGATIGADTGVVEIPITLDGQTVKKQFSWSCGKQGPQGVKGENGNKGKSVQSVIEYYLATSASSGVTSSTSGWSIDPTTQKLTAEKKYLWNCKQTVYDDGTRGSITSPVICGTYGETGKNALQSNRTYTGTYTTVGETAYASTSSFNRIPIVGDIYSCLDGSSNTGTWQVTAISGTNVTVKLLGYIKSKGEDGKNGADGDSFAWNMLSETNCGKKHWGTESSGGKYSVEDFITEDNIDAVKLICTEAISTSNWSYVSFKDIKMLKQLKPSTKYTLSYDIKANRSGAISHSICKGDVSNFCTNTVVVNNIIGNETWQHISVVLTTNDLKTTPTNEILYLGRNALSKVGYSIIKNLKLVEGDIDTPWSPSQSDIEGKGVVETVQYYLATSQASGVTSSTSGWSTDITTQKLTADKKYLWNCYQTKYSDGTSEPISTPKVIGVYGDKGQTGEDGQDGAGFHWNLLKYSGDLSKQVLGGAGTYTATVESIEDKTTPSGQAEKITYTVQGTGGKFIQTGKYIKEGNIKQGKTYTVSVWCKCSSIKSTGVINAEFLDNKTYVNPTLSTEWQQYVVTGVANKDVTSTSSASAISFYYNDNMSVGDIFYISSPKVEEGDKASPWCTTYEETLAKNLSITPSSQYFKSTDGGKTFTPDTITIKPTIQGEISFGKWQYSIDGGVSFADIVSGQKGLTINNNVLTVSKDSSLYSDAVTMVTFRAVANDSSFYDTCSIAKIYDVSDIGDGRNLLWNSNFAKTDEAITGTTNSWGLHTRGTNLVASIDTSTKHNGFNTLKTVSAANGDKNSSNDLEWFAWGISERTSDNLHSKNQNYTLSFYAKASVTTDFIVRWGYDAYGADTTRTLTTNWQKYEIKLHQATSAYSITIIFKLLTAGTVWFSEFKLEKGSSATGYSTAPEDLQTAILSTKSEISDVSIKVNNNKQAIEQRVEKTTYEQDLNLVKGNISKANEGLNKWRYEIYPKSLFTSEYQGKSTMDVFAKNTNLTPSQSVLINDTDLSIAWNYAENYIGYALTFAKFSAAKSVAITFAHDDGAHIYLNGKLIGGSDAYNKNGESLTLGFVKGWNCIEVVVNEGASTEGFKLGTTISAISECQLMNCYYGTPVARQSHITNQLVENTTNIEGVTTTMQKVMTTVGGSDRIDEFVNNYNKTIESEKQFKKTIGETYTTKDEFNGLEIGGRNLLTKDDCNMSKWQNLYPVHCKVTNNDYSNHIDYVPTGGEWEIIYKKISVTKGQKYILSFDYKVNKAYNYLSGQKYGVYLSTSVPANAAPASIITNGQYAIENTVTNIKRGMITFTAPIDTLYIVINGGCIDDNQTGLSFEFNKWKLEKGNKATDWTPAPEDDEINGQNLVSNLPSNWEQGSINYTANLAYGSLKSTLVSRLRTKDVFPVSGNITISAGTSTNSSKEELNFYYVLFDINKKSISHGDTWQSLTSPKIINCGDAKYMTIILKWGSGTTTMNPSDISQICLKIERGTSATPFTLAPEDVNGKIVNVETIANQTANKFSWIVKSGTSSSNFEITDRLMNLVSANINLDGIVSFMNTAKGDGRKNLYNLDYSSFEDVASQEDAICYAKDNGVTSVGIDSSVSYDGNKSLKISYTTANLNSSTTPLYLGSSANNYGCVKIQAGKQYILSCYVKSDSTTGLFMIDIQGHDTPDTKTDGLYLSNIDPRKLPGSSTGVNLSTDWQRAVCAIKVADNATGLYWSVVPLIWGKPSSSSAPKTFNIWVDCIMLEEVDSISNEPGTYILDKETIIDGGSVKADTITGNQILAGSITADKIATDAIKSRNYDSSGGTQGSFLNLGDGSFTSPNLSWDSNGNLIASNANLSGLINATKGTVGGWNIATNGLYSGIDENAIKIYSATTYDAQTMYQKQKIQDSFILSQKYINHFVSQQVSVGHNIPYWQTRSFIYNDSQIQLAQSDYCINTSSASNYDAQYSLKDGYISATRIYMEQNITQVGGDVINSSFSIGLDSMMGWCSIQSTKGINIYGNSSRALYVQSNDTSKYNALETEGDVVVNGKIHAVSGDNKIQLNSDNNGSIELYGNTPFIDFHSAYSSADYTCRIIANTPEQLLVCGKLRCDSNIISNNDLIANSWVYAGQNAHYTWQNQLDCYFSCGYYNNTNNVYYYAGYHAFYVNEDSGSGMMYIDTSGVSSRKGFRNSSDERIKQNFSHFDDNFIDTYMNLEPVQYQFKNDTNDKYHFGFKAQQTERILNAYGQESDKSYGICATHAINPEKAEKLYGVKDMHEEYTLAYDELIAPTTYMVQHTYKELESTKNELEQVKQEKADLETRLQAIEAKLGL